MSARAKAAPAKPPPTTTTRAAASARARRRQQRGRRAAVTALRKSRRLQRLGMVAYPLPCAPYQAAIALISSSVKPLAMRSMTVAGLWPLRNACTAATISAGLRPSEARDRRVDTRTAGWQPEHDDAPAGASAAAACAAGKRHCNEPRCNGHAHRINPQRPKKANWPAFTAGRVVSRDAKTVLFFSGTERCACRSPRRSR